MEIKSHTASVVLQRRLRRIRLIERRHARHAIELYSALESAAMTSQHYTVQLDALYGRYIVLERLSEAHHLLDALYTGLSLAEIYRLPIQAGQCLEALGRIYYTAGDYKEAVHYWMECIAAGALTSSLTSALNSHTTSMIEARIGLGQVYDAIGDWHNGARFLMDAGTLLEHLDDPYLRSKQAINLAVNQQQLGQLDAAKDLLAAAIVQAERGNIAEYVAEAHWHLGMNALRQNDFLVAQTSLELALHKADACAYRWLQAAARTSLANLFEAQANDPAKSPESKQQFIALAIDNCLQALNDAEHVDSTGQQAQCCLALSRLYEEVDDVWSALRYQRRYQQHTETQARTGLQDRYKELREVDLSQKSPIELLLELSVSRQSDHQPSSSAIHRITAGALSILRIDLISVWLLEPSCLSMICHSAHSPNGLGFALGDAFPDVANSAYLKLLASSQHPLVAQDIRLHPAIVEIEHLYGQSGLQSLVDIPLRMHDQFVGFLSFGQCHQRRHWSREDVLFGSHIASLLQQNLVHIELTAALQKVKVEADNRQKAELALQQSYDVLKERSADMLKLSRIGRELTATLNLEQAFERVYRQVSAKLDAYVFGIGLYDAAAQKISMVYLMEDGQRQPNIVFDMSERSRPAVWCVREKRELVVAVREEMEAYVGPLLPVLFGKSMQSLVYMPLTVGGEVIACLTVQNPHQHAFRADQIEFLTVLASYTAIAVSNSIAHGALAAAHRRTQETQQQMVLQEKMAGLGTLTAGVAHEINNPTNFVHVSAQNLRVDIGDFQRFVQELVEGDEDPEILQAFDTRFTRLSEHVSTILNGTERIKGIVRDLRSFTRLGESDRKRTKMSECLLSTLNLVRTSWQDQVNFITNFEEDPEIYCWPALLNQVFMNLMVNACQAMAEKHSQATADTQKHPKLNLRISTQIEQDFLLIHFDDEGIGMATETQSHVMEPFFTTKDVGAGTGLGLSIAYGIVERHHGRLSFTSSFGQGSCFTVSLPLQ